MLIELYKLLLEVMPGLGFFRIPSRAVLILNFALAVMAAHGGAWLLEEGRERWRAASWRVPAIAGLALVLAFFVTLPYTKFVHAIYRTIALAHFHRKH